MRIPPPEFLDPPGIFGRLGPETRAHAPARVERLVAAAHVDLVALGKPDMEGLRPGIAPPREELLEIGEGMNRGEAV